MPRFLLHLTCSHIANNSEFGKDLSKVIAKMETMKERISYVTRLILPGCRLDITDYLKNIYFGSYNPIMRTVISIILRFFDDDGFHPAPIFDNGVSLLTANKSIHWIIMLCLTGFQQRKKVWEEMFCCINPEDSKTLIKNTCFTSLTNVS